MSHEFDLDHRGPTSFEAPDVLYPDSLDIGYSDLGRPSSELAPYVLGQTASPEVVRSRDLPDAGYVDYSNLEGLSVSGSGSRVDVEMGSPHSRIDKLKAWATVVGLGLGSYGGYKLADRMAAGLDTRADEEVVRDIEEYERCMSAVGDIAGQTLELSDITPDVVENCEIGLGDDYEDGLVEDLNRYREPSRGEVVDVGVEAVVQLPSEEAIQSKIDRLQGELTGPGTPEGWLLRIFGPIGGLIGAVFIRIPRAATIGLFRGFREGADNLAKAMQNQ